MARSSGLEVTSDRDGAKKLKDLEDLFRKARDHRKPFEEAWYMNLAFFQGEQWYSFALNRFGRPKMAPWRNLFVDNKVQPAILAEVAKLTKNEPVWDASPSSPDEGAVSDALLANRVAKGKWDDLGCNGKLEKVATWAQICGTAFEKLTWDPFASGTGAEVAVNPDTNEPLTRPSTGEMIRRDDEVAEMVEKTAAEAGMQIRWENIGHGDVSVVVRSPFDIYVDPLAGDAGLSSARWLIEEAVRSPEDLQQRFKLPEAPKADSAPTPGLIEARLPGASTSGEKVGVRTWELWERPSPKFPKGRHAVWCDKHLLVLEENPTKDGGLPYAMYVARWVPGRFWGMSLADQIRPLNLELNKSRSQSRENAARISNPPLLVPRDQQGWSWQGLPGENVMIDPYAGQPGGPALPQFMPVPSLPGYVQNEPAMIEASIDRASHQSEVSRGQVPAGVTAASAIQLLQEADQTIIAMDARRFEGFVEETGQMMLDLVAENYRTERLIQIAGEDDTWDVQAFRAGQWNHDVPTVRVRAGSMIPQSPAARQAQMSYILSLLVQHGYPIDAQSMGDFLRDYEVGGLERLMGAFSEDARQVAAENQQLLDAAQEPPPVNEWDNHAGHLRGHEKVMKSRTWQIVEKDVRDRFVAHWQEHQQAMKSEQAEEAQQAMMAQAGRGAAQPQGGSPSAEARDTAGLTAGPAPPAPPVG